MEMNVDARLFYLISSASLFLMWLLFSTFGGEDFHRRIGRSVIAIRPSYLPSSALVFLLKYPFLYRSLCHVMIATFALAALYPDVWLARLLAAVVFSMYHLAEYVIKYVTIVVRCVLVCGRVVVIHRKPRTHSTIEQINFIPPPTADRQLLIRTATMPAYMYHGRWCYCPWPMRRVSLSACVCISLPQVVSANFGLGG